MMFGNAEAYDRFMGRWSRVVGWMRGQRNLTKTTCPYAVQVNYPNY
jgi:hypothetical protein